MENGWIKYFSDNTFIYATDGTGLSWDNTRLDGMIKADIFLNGQSITFEGEGEYHQSEDYVILLSNIEQPEMLSRRLQKKISDGCWLTATIFSGDGGIEITIETNKIGSYYD